MSRKSAYKQVLSIGTAVVLGFALFTGSLDEAPKLLSPQSDEQAAALAEKQNESPSRTDDEADLVARLESGTASSTDSEGGQSTDDGSESTTTGTGDGTSADSPSTRSKIPISTARAAYTSPAFPTTPVTPTLPFAPTARTRWARRRSRSMNTSGPPKKDALRSSLNSTAWAAPAKHSPA